MAEKNKKPETQEERLARGKEILRQADEAIALGKQALERLRAILDEISETQDKVRPALQAHKLSGSILLNKKETR